MRRRFRGVEAEVEEGFSIFRCEFELDFVNHFIHTNRVVDDFIYYNKKINSRSYLFFIFFYYLNTYFKYFIKYNFIRDLLVELLNFNKNL